MSFVCCLALALMVPGKFYPSVSYTSDYRYNGVSYSGREPTPQASLHWLGPRGWYAGAWTSGVDFDDPGNTSIEGDLYVGRAVDFGPNRVAGEILYTFFPDKTFRGPTYDFFQLKVRGSRSFEALTLGALTAWTPRGFVSLRSSVASRGRRGVFDPPRGEGERNSGAPLDRGRSGSHVLGRRCHGDLEEARARPALCRYQSRRAPVRLHAAL